MRILNYNISTSLDSISKAEMSLMINTINPHSYCIAKKDQGFRKALKHSNILIPDGIGIVKAAQILNRKKIKRITGADLHQHLLEKASLEKKKVFYMGAAPSTLKLIEERLKIEHPNILVASYSPPYKLEFTKDDNARIVASINAFNPDILFIGMTAPKQEKWAYQHNDQLDTKIIASIGAVFDFYAGSVKRPGIFWQRIGMEWFPRLLREPKRLWKRNFVSTPCFLWDVLKAKVGCLKFDK